MNKVGVVHLVRAVNGIEPFHRFLDSYLAHPAGIDNELILLFKGFQPDQIGPYRDLLRHIPYQTLEMDDQGFDITPYMRAARTFPHLSFCFLNSFSEILADNWLLLLHQHCAQTGVGMVGASGSWESTSTNLLRMLEQKRTADMLTRIRYILLVARYRKLFPPFPNYHLRTNAFLMNASLLRTIDVRPIRTKRDAQVFESGYHSISRQVQARRMQVVVVGRDGIAYPPEEWWRSNTFRNGDQSNVLVADNRTRDYASASPEDRRILTQFTWGQRALHTGALSI